MDQLNITLKMEYAIRVTFRVREDYGHDIRTWDEMSRDWAMDFIHDAHVDQMLEAECAFHIVNGYAKRDKHFGSDL